MRNKKRDLRVAVIILHLTVQLGKSMDTTSSNWSSKSPNPHIPQALLVSGTFKNCNYTGLSKIASTPHFPQPTPKNTHISSCKIVQSIILATIIMKIYTVIVHMQMNILIFSFPPIYTHYRSPPPPLPLSYCT